MKWAVSQRPGGALDNAQYLSGVHRTVRWDTRTVCVEAHNGHFQAVAPDCLVCTGQSGQRSDPTVDSYRPQRSVNVVDTGQ
jgi:hypothetical protein